VWSKAVEQSTCRLTRLTRRLTVVLKQPAHSKDRSWRRPPRALLPPSLQVSYVQGWGKISSPNEVSVSLNDGSSTQINTKNIMIATGSEVTPLPGVPIDEERWALLLLLLLLLLAGMQPCILCRHHCRHPGIAGAAS
jgi:hypothetical protein